MDDEYFPEPGSQLNNDTNLQPVNTGTNIINKNVKPLIIKDINELKNNQTLLKTLTSRWFKDIKIDTLKFTQNGNLLIFPQELADYEKLKKLVFH